MSYGVHPYSVDFRRLAAVETESLGGFELETLVRRLGGQFLDNGLWSSMRMEGFDRVDDALKAAGSAVDLSSVFMAGPPVKIVPPDDWPMIGHVRPEQVAALQVALTAVTVSGEAGESVAQVVGWMTGLREGHGLVTFYY